jgi:hypothetical protein
METLKPGDRGTTEAIITSVYAALTRHDVAHAVEEMRQMPIGGMIISIMDDMPPQKTLLSHTRQSLAEKRVTAMTSMVRTEAELDPAKALEIALAFQADFSWDDGFYIVFSRWPQMNLEQATQAMLKLPAGRLAEASRCIVNSLAWEDPQAALTWAHQLPEGEMRSNALQFAVEQWARKDPEAAFHHAQELPRLREKDAVLEGIISVWSLNDPKSAVEFIDQLPSGPSKAAMLQAALVAWGLGDIKSAMPRIQEISSIKERNVVLNQVLWAWVKADPDSVLKWTQGLPSNERDAVRSRALDALARSNPAWAAEWLDKISDYPRKNDAIQEVVFYWQQKDPEAAWRWTQKLPDSEFKNQISSGILGMLASVDLKAAMAHLAEFPEGPSKDSCIEALVRYSLDSDLHSALKLLDTATPSIGRDDCLLSLGSLLGQLDPKAACVYGEAYAWQQGPRMQDGLVHTFPPGYWKREFLKNILPLWFAQDSSAASAWLKGLPDDEARKELYLDVARAWVLSGPNAATNFALSLPPDRGRDDYIDTIAEVKIDRDPVEAFDWIKKLKDPADFKLAQRNAIEYLALSDPESAVKHVDSLSDQKMKLQIMEAVAPDWARKDPVAAAHWVSTFPESVQKGNALSLVAQRWVDLQPEKAGVWLDQLPPSPSRDAAVYGYSHGIYEGNHAKIALAYQWAQKIADATRRQALETDLFEQWLIIDPTTATPVIQKSDLPDDKKSDLLQARQSH